MASRVVDGGRLFSNEVREVTSLYVDLSYDSSLGATGVKRSPAPGRRVECDSSIQSGPPPPSNPALTIAQRLKEIGDNIDKKVLEELQRVLTNDLKPTIFQLQAEQYSSVCRKVLNTCSGYLHTGWEQAAVVIMGVCDLIRELRDRGEDEHSPREEMVNGFAGEVLEELHLREWIEAHGGMAQFGISNSVPTGSATVPIEGTEV